MEIHKSKAYDAFSCIASACTDSCCRLWDVEVDEKSLAFYKKLPGKLGDDLRKNLTIGDDGAYFTVREGRCPMWRADGLCRIQAELGEQALCRTCREFPRLTHDYGCFAELQLEMSCPEAARLLLNFDWDTVTTRAEGAEAPEYDTEEMELLLKSREEALRIAKSYAPGDALSLLLLYGYHTQSALEGMDLGAFSPEKALQTAKQFHNPDLSGLFGFFSDLEILTAEWEEKLCCFHSPEFDSRMGRLITYFIMRYWLQSVSDGDLAARVKAIVTSCLVIACLDGDIEQTARMYSKEIENCAENMDAILDGAYDAPALTDERLLSLLNLSA